jgi:acyl-CoA thioesterase YciA
VEVFAERMHEGDTNVTRVTEATLTYVAIDENRRPRPLP